MTCIKTGCHIFLTQYNEYAYGDAFAYDCPLVDRTTEARKTKQLEDELAYRARIGTSPVYAFHLCQRSREPLHPSFHFTVDFIEDWLVNQTVCIATQVTNHGYYGQPIKEK